jgi:hypothetical protein
MRRLLRAAAVPSLAALGLAGVAAPAEAASGSLTVTTVDRAGHASAADVTVTSIATNLWYKLSPGKSRKLPDGRYAVVTIIAPNGVNRGPDQTLGVKEVAVHGRHIAMRFDARQGKRFQVIPNVAGAEFLDYEMGVCVAGAYAGGMDASPSVEGYVIPTNDKNVRSDYEAAWAMSTSGPFYWVAGKKTQGIPTRPVYSYTHASFAKLQVKVLPGNVKDAHTTLFMGIVAGQDASCAGGTITWADFPVPRTVTAYVSGGYWSPYIDYQGGTTVASINHFVAGKVYHLTLDRRVSAR